MLVNDMDEKRTGIETLGSSSHQTEEELLDLPRSNHAEDYLFVSPRKKKRKEKGLPVRLFNSLPIFPALAKLNDFKEDIPAKILKHESSPRISPQKDDERSLLDFLEQIPPEKVTWEFDATKKVLHFGPYHRTIFKRIADILYSYHKNNLFSGDVIGRMRVDSNGHITHPYEPVKTSNLEGRKVDMIHFRWLVAKVVRKYFGKDYELHLSKYFKLFFSELFLQPAVLKRSYMFQYYHPVFYNDGDKYKLLKVLRDLRKRDEKYFTDCFGLGDSAYGYSSWWSLLENENDESMLGGVYLYENNNINLYDNNPNSLPIFLRNCHEHFTGGTETKNKRIIVRNREIKKENKEIQMKNDKVRQRMQNSGQRANLQLGLLCTVDEK
uniref:Uncharacterized protein n=1 Tax=Quercus lobata TaxID=97700 RepID=A0A7N2MZA3_QUELO